MIETPILFGPDSSLVGVLTRPEALAVADSTVCLTFNAGVVPRIGPHRFNVKLARALASDGITSLRFDLGGLGDSRTTTSQLNFIDQAVADIQSAMDYCGEQFGIREFSLIGNCSGAVQIYWAALRDERVKGILMFDGFVYPTRWTRPIRHWKRLRAGGVTDLFRIAHRRLQGLVRLVRTRPVRAEAPPLPDTASNNPSHVEFGAALQKLCDRGVSVKLVYSGGVMDWYSYAGQFRDRFANEPFFRKIQCDFLPEIDHTLLSLESQQILITKIREWLRSIDGTGGQTSEGKRIESRLKEQ